MGRTKTYDEQDVISRALDTFWDHGYTETGVLELETATGLGRSSIYHAFGSKRQLFDAAVERYLDDVIRPRLAPLLQSPVAPNALEDDLRALRTAVLDERSSVGAHGCLLMNAVASPLHADEALRTVARHYYADLHRAYTAGAAARHPDRPASSTEALATTCTSMVLSAMMLVRINRDTAAHVIDTTLRIIAEP